MWIGYSGSSPAVRRTIVVGEVAASVVLICAAVPLFKSLAKRQQVDAGGRIDHVTTMSADLPSTAYATAESAVISMKPSCNGSDPCLESSRPLSRSTCLFKACGGASLSPCRE